jgi:hypothetical protein
MTLKDLRATEVSSLPFGVNAISSTRVVPPVDMTCSSAIAGHSLLLATMGATSPLA